MSKTLLVIDDEENMRHMLISLLKKNAYRISEAENGEQALEQVREKNFDFILCDIRMPGMDGIGFLQAARKNLEHTTVIMMSAYGSIDIALKAMREGAYDYISKPFKADEVLLTLKKAEERQHLQNENSQLKTEIRSIQKRETFVDVIGQSHAIKALIQQAAKVAQYDASVLITGESGTGKELIARGIHNHSTRNKNPIVTVNCASIPANLLESEFFGFTKGAFTGAETSKIGFFKEADGSTLFLDEIGELPMELQAKLLRVLQEGEVRALGASKTEKIDVRIVAATAKNLDNEVKNGKFRQDLLFRLNVVELLVPPLRERRGDIALLTDYFIEHYRVKMDSPVTGVAQDTLKQFSRYDWQGNIRELKNVIEHAMIYCESDQIAPCDLPPRIRKEGQQEQLNAPLDTYSIKEGKAQLERALIEKALKETDGNKSQAAALLELSYPSLLAKIKEYNLS